MFDFLFKYINNSIVSRESSSEKFRWEEGVLIWIKVVRTVTGHYLKSMVKLLTQTKVIEKTR